MTKFSFDIDRENIFEIAMKHYRSKFKNEKQVFETPIINFRHGGIIEREGYGPGVTKDFYSQFFQKSLFENRMFVGEGRCLVPSNEQTHSDREHFASLGVAIVESILNNDCGFPYLSQTIFNYLMDIEFESHMCVEELPPGDVKALVELVRSIITISVPY